jgi:acetyl esterase/lipase
MRRGFALGAASVALFLSLWIWLPAPTRPFLTLSIGAPEVSVWLVVMGALTATLAWMSRRRRLGRIALGMSIAAILLPMSVLVRIPSTARALEREMEAGLGPDYLATVPRTMHARLQEQPISVRQLFFGRPEGSARRERAISFAMPDGYELTLDVYRPTDTGPWPVVVQIYGGGWRAGSPSDHGEAARSLAGAGYVVYAVDYRHSPRWRWPAQRDDVCQALRWIAEHTHTHGGDPSRIAILGRSSGAQLAFAAAAAPNVPAVGAIVALYTPVDLEHAYRNPPVPDTLDIRRLERDLFGGSPDDFPEAYREASPITLAARPHPPVLLIGGSRDRIVQRARLEALDAKLDEHGTSVLLMIPWADHGFDAVGFGPSAQLSTYYTERFLAWALTRR